MPTKQELGLAIKRLQWRHHRELNKLLSTNAGLSLVQWDVLRHVSEQPEASLHALAELTFQTDQSMGELAQRMIKRGLLERVDGPGRAVRHRLTDTGKKAFVAGSGLADQVFAGTVGQLTKDEQTELQRLINKALGA